MLRKKRTKLILFFSIVYSLFSLGRSAATDSIKAIINDPNVSDSISVEAQFALAWYYYENNPDTAIIICANATRMSEDKNFKWGMSGGYGWLAFLYRQEGKYDTALEYIFKSLKLRKELGEEKDLVLTYSDIGDVYFLLKKYQLAKKFYRESINQAIKIKDERGRIRSLTTYGNVLYDEKKHDSCLAIYNETLAFHASVNDSANMGSSYHNLASTYDQMGDFEKALEYYKISLKLGKHNSGTITSTYSNMAQLYFELNNIDKSLEYNNIALKLSEEANNKQVLEAVYNLSYKIYKLQGKYSQALEMHEKYTKLMNDLFNDKTKKAVLEQTIKYGYDLKEAQIKAELEKQKALDESEKQKQSLLLMISLISLVVISGVAIFIYRTLSITKDQKNIIEETNEELNNINGELASQRDEIEKQKELVDTKNLEITSSIQYAKRIQEAILPPRELLNKYLHDGFVLYAPKDVVAGDFYWLDTVDNKVFFAVADCTGHGVPGAMVSVVCNSALNRCIREYKIERPSEILDKTRELVINTFEKSARQVMDGMDICLCVWDKNTGNFEYAGANNPLYLLKKDRALEIIVPDKQPVGYSEKSNKFTNHTIDLANIDSIYLFTDGYADQFGGVKGKKMGYKKFREKLIEVSSLEMNEQEVQLEVFFSKWRGAEEQVDDVCVMGIKI